MTDALAIERAEERGMARDDGNTEQERTPLSSDAHCRTAADGKYSVTADNTGALSRGLRLVVRGASRSWTMAFTSPVTGKRRELGLGKFPEIGLAKARKEASRYRDQVAHGIDPIEAAQALREAGAAKVAAKKIAAKHDSNTLRRVARAYHETLEDQLTPKHWSQWINSIEQHVPTAILDKPIASIEAAELLDALRPITQQVPETARRIRQRLDAVWDDAVLRKIAPTNVVKPLARALRTKVSKQHWRALPFDQVPDLVQRLRDLPGTAARALEFGILTAARTSEILDMEWSEVSRDGKTWTVPAGRMKAGEEHVVYLSSAARAVLKRVKGLSERWVFRSPEGDQALSNMAMLNLLRRLEIDAETTVHGVARSSFSTWANETHAARPDVIEACLAHKEADAVRRAYNRAKFAAERRELLEKWAGFIDGEPKQ